MTAVNLSYKLRWMSTRLKWINKASEIQDWVAAMESVRTLLSSVVNMELVGQRLSLIRKKTVSRPLNIDIVPRPLTKMNVTSKHDTEHSSHLITSKERGETTSSRNLNSMNIDIPQRIASVTQGAMRDDPEIGGKDIVLIPQNDPREPSEDISRQLEVDNITSKQHRTKMNKPVSDRLVVKGIRTCPRVTKPQDEISYGPVLHQGRLNKELCRRYLRQWLLNRGENTWDFKGYKFEMLLRDFGTCVKIDNGRTCKVFRNFVSYELKLKT